MDLATALKDAGIPETAPYSINVDTGEVTATTKDMLSKEEIENGAPYVTKPQLKKIADIANAMFGDSPERAKLRLLEQAKQRRRAMAAQGVDIGGKRIQSDAETRSALAEVILAAQHVPGFKTRWKTDDGFEEVDGEKAIEFLKKVAEQRALAFALEEQTIAAINSGEMKTPEEIDAVFDGE